MTATEVPAELCPTCGKDTTIALDAGGRFCVECRSEYDPTLPRPVLRSVPETVVGVTVDDVLGPPAGVAPPAYRSGQQIEATLDDIDDYGEPEEAERYLDSLVGTRVLLEGGQWATLVGFPDDDHAKVVLDADLHPNHSPPTADEVRHGIGGGTVVTVVDFNSIMRGDPIPELEPGGPVDVVDDATAELIGDAAMTFARLIIRAGCASLAGEGVDRVLVDTPVGYLPDDGEAIPLLEQGAAIAVALLMQTWAIPTDRMLEALDKLEAEERESAETEQGDNGES